MDQHHHQHHEHNIHVSPIQNSEIDVSVVYNKKKLSIRLEDDEQKPPRLRKNHEKLMHLIVVSVDLKDFFHLHPTQVDAHSFEAEWKLDENKAYKAFVDITVEDKNYLIKPIPISNEFVGMESSLEIDNNPIKSIKGKQIQLDHSPFIVNHKVELAFTIKDATPDPYLGALGHVVIIDKKVEKFIHVHPRSENETVFDTHFSTPGIYKLWAEFKFGEEIVTYPYVFKVEEDSYVH